MKRTGIIAILLLCAVTARASTAGPSGPTVGANNTAAGTIPWVSPGNITAEDAILSSATMTAFNVFDSAVNLVKGGSIVGNNEASVTEWPATLTYSTYGGSSDLWGTVWTAADINGTTFGAVLQASSCPSSPAFTNYLQGSSFGFSIPSNTSILGIMLEIKKVEGACSSGGLSFIAGTMISTPRGDVAIEKLKTGDAVYSFAEQPPYALKANTIDRAWSHSVNYLEEVKTAECRVVTTPDHKFFTGDGYREAFQLPIGAQVLTQTRIARKLSRVTENFVINKKASVYEFALKSTPHNYFANGFGVHNACSIPVGGECAAVDYMRITVTYIVLPQIVTTSGSGTVSTLSGSGTVTFK